MQLVRIGEFEKEKPALLIDGKYFDVSDHVIDYNEAFFAADGLGKLGHILATKDLPEIKNPSRLGSCVASPSIIRSASNPYRTCVNPGDQCGCCNEDVGLS